MMPIHVSTHLCQKQYFAPLYPVMSNLIKLPFMTLKTLHSHNRDMAGCVYPVYSESAETKGAANV